jgi:hypothetical protein
MAYSFNKVCTNTIPEGTYKAQVTDIKFKTSSTTDEKYDMNITLTIAEGAFAKRTIIDFMSEKAFSFRLKPFLTALGLDLNREFDTARELYEWGIKEAKGKFLMITVGTRTYQGNEYNNVTGFAPLPGSTTSMEDVLNEFGASPELTPEKPTIEDIPNIDNPDFSPVAEVADDDLPF